MTFTVTFNPDMSNIGAELRRRIDQVPDALEEFAAGQTAKMEAYAKENRPWTDRTNAARAGITGEVIREGNKITGVIYHTATSPTDGYEYPKVLELGSPPHSNGHPGTAPRPILAPTFAAHQTETAEGARRIVLSLVGGRVL